MTRPCPVCNIKLVKETEQRETRYLECARCGPYSLTSKTEWYLQRALQSKPEAAAKLSYMLRKMTDREQWALLTAEMLDNILSNASLPTPKQQFENLILWLGSKQPHIARRVPLTESTVATIGTLNKETLGFLCVHAQEIGLVVSGTRPVENTYELSPAQLTFKGWEYFLELQRSVPTSYSAFMAMQFGDVETDAIYREHFKPAISATGFELKRLDESQPAGLIDDRLRIEIRQARFLIADLTHHNKGAYWEAGYAEGLGKPVIYTCRKDSFDKEGTHFDTNHHLTVIWEPGKMPEAVEKLKATVRATLPDVAKLTDSLPTTSC